MPFFNARKMLNSTLPSFLAALSLGGPASCSAAAQAVADVCPPLGSALTGGPAASHGCAALELAYPGSTFFPGEEVYEYEAQAFWSNTQLMNPGCVFRPLGAQEVACAVAAAKATNSEFAVRGGGHMGIRGANNIDDGVLMVMSNLTTLEYSESDQVLTLGPGHTWGAVYKYLSQFDRAVAGGRLSPVGVPGLLLAGGVNFHANQHGWSADNVLEYEVVLADGSIAKATADENADLFWALKGGSSNFGIVTQFKLRTFESTQVWAGTHTVTGDHIDEMFAAVADFTLNNKDAKSHIVPMTIAMSPEMTVVSVILFYDSPTVAAPECFSKILAIPAIANSCGFKTLSDFAFETGALVYDKINDLFIAGTTVGRDYDALLQGLRITNDVFFAALPELYAQVPPANLSLVSIDWQPITPLWQAGSRAANPGGSPLDSVDPAAKGSYLAWAEVVEWVGSEYDAAVLAWVEKTTAAINDATKAAGLFDPFNYMGDAAGFQEVYAGYGAENQKRLLDISRKYDPERVFQNLLPGGFKIGQ